MLGEIEDSISVHSWLIMINMPFDNAVGIIIETLLNEIARDETATASQSQAEEANNVIDTTFYISKVNNQIRDSANGEFEPCAVAIGPYHENWDSTAAVEVKKQMLRRALRQAGSSDHDQRAELSRYVNEINGLVERVKQCYSWTPENDERMATMLLLDGLFIVSWFVLGTGPSGRTSESQWWLDDATVVRDVLYILENQVPFFVVETIHELVERGESREDLLHSLTRYVRNLVKGLGYATGIDLAGEERPCHLLNLLHRQFRPVTLDQRQRDGDGDGLLRQIGGNAADPCRRLLQLVGNTCFSWITTRLRLATSPGDEPEIVLVPRWRTAVYYREHGVRLRARDVGGRDGARSILDVELRGDKLLIPCLTIDKETWIILRNLMALEQSNPKLGSYVTTYCLLMSQLASREKDVELLSDKGIIFHFLKSDGDVAACFGNLCNGIVLEINDPTNLNYLSPTWVALEGICRSGRRRSMAWMRQSQCNNYAMTVALAAAVILFVCTVLQTVFAALGYKKQ